MARKATVDRDVVLQMLNTGYSTHSVAQRFGVSRQAIDLHRREFIKKGLLSDERAPRKRVTTGKNDEAEGAGSQGVPSLDQVIDLVIEAFNSLRKLPSLEIELEKYKQDIEKASNRIELLENEVRKRKEQEQRWLLAVERKEASKSSNQG